VTTTPRTELIILDRDGVINFDSPQYIKTASEFKPIPGSIDAIARLYQIGFKIYVATNQAGLAKKKFEQRALTAMHQKLIGLVDEAGGKIEHIYYCPHHPAENCQCRKPQPGMLLQIASHAALPIEDADFVGDSLKDVEAAYAANANPVLVLTGNGKTTVNLLDSKIPTFRDLADYADSKIEASV
jgi:D-glycero-D-manno-heptose 1,7-bisphosphate phosphatase